MSRSEHSRPREIIAADRILYPHRQCGSGDHRDGQDSLRRVTTVVSGGLPRISVRRPRRGYFHPADKMAIRGVLTYFGELSWYGTVSHPNSTRVEKVVTFYDAFMYGA